MIRTRTLILWGVCATVVCGASTVHGASYGLPRVVETAASVKASKQTGFKHGSPAIASTASGGEIAISTRYFTACCDDWEILLVGSEGARVRFLTKKRKSDTDDHSPAWSPDGRRIAFGSCCLSGRGPRAWGIHVARVDGKGLRRLTRNGDDCCLDWSPDGRTLVFERGEKGIYRMAASGGRPRRITSKGREPQ